jgi:hypothetical protein
MTNREPRKDWTPDSEGSPWAAESTYDDRMKRARDKEASRKARMSVRDLLSGGESARARNDRDRG